MKHLKQFAQYAWNILVATGWALWLVLGTVVGVERQRVLKTLRPTRKLRARRVVVSPAVKGPQLVVAPDAAADAESALRNLGMAKPDARRAVKAAKGAGAETIETIIGHATQAGRAS